MARDHPLYRGSNAVEQSPRDPPASHTALFALVALALGTTGYLTTGYLSNAAGSLFPPPPVDVANIHPSSAVNQVVNLGYASYKGRLDDSTPNVISWLGVPYARPPRRFRAAQPLDETPQPHTPQDAQAYPPFCVQSWSPWVGLDDRGGAGSEDCLFLNVYAPRVATNISSLPVLVYIHGGGYYNGNPHTWPFDNWIERSPTPFIAVSIYYRLSALGFLAAPEAPGKGVHAGEDPELQLNAGIHDQRLALKFVQKHIAAFGGDPNRVTIMGQSAGAGSVGLHLVAKSPNPTESLFHRAILQSWYRPPVPLPIDRKASWNHLTKYVGCSHWSWSTLSTLECLRQVDHVKLVQAADEGMAKHLKDANWMWQPVLDNVLFSEYPGKVISPIPDVDVMAGHTTHDSVVVGSPFTDWVRAAYPKLSAREAHTLEQMYTKAGVAPEDVVNVGIGEGMLRCSTEFLGKVYGSRAYTYRFDHPNPTANPDRADHAAENYLLFEGTTGGSNGTNTFHPLTPAERALSDQFIAYITAFVATGDPNSAPSSSSFLKTKSPADTLEFHSPTWQPHTSGTRMVFRVEGGGTGSIKGVKGGSFVEALDGGEVERCKVWEGMAVSMQV